MRRASAIVRTREDDDANSEGCGERERAYRVKGTEREREKDRGKVGGGREKKQERQMDERREGER